MLSDCIRVERIGDDEDDVEDIFSASLGTIFVNDTQNCHGDPDTVIIYKRGSDLKDLRLTVSDPSGEGQRRLFAHYLWNASLWVAQALEHRPDTREGALVPNALGLGAIDVRDQDVLELGAGLGLAGIISCLAGARKVVISDYPAPELLKNLNRNVDANVAYPLRERISIQGHQWGEMTDELSKTSAHKFNCVIAADCLWMPHEHRNLAASMSHFLSKDCSDARVYVVAGFHTGRAKMAGFFDIIGDFDLSIERIWEEDVEGERREWTDGRTSAREDITAQKRWLAVAILKRAS